MRRPDLPSCARCKHFQNDALQVEAALPGLSSLSSAFAAVRCSDGICAVHERYVAASSICPAFEEGYSLAESHAFA
jgi:hypothetical protein